MGCSSSEDKFEFKFKELSLKKTESIDISGIDDFDCTLFTVDRKENLFLLNSRYIKVVKLDSKGDVVSEMTKKGEGPGEVKDFPSITTHKNLWLKSYRKICIYNPETLELLHNIRFDKGGHNITPLTENSWLSTRGTSVNDDWGTELWLNNTEAKAHKLFSIDKGGRLIVKYDKGTISFFPGTPITHDLLFCISDQNIICANSFEYKLFLKDKTGKTLKVVELPHINPEFTEEAKKNVIDEFVTQYNKGIQESMKKAFIKVLPDKLCALVNIRNLPNNKILVRSVIKYKHFRDDIFDENLNYLYSLKTPLLNGKSFETYNNKIYNLTDENEKIEIYNIKGI